MNNYIGNFFGRIYEIINPEYARHRRMARFEELRKLRQLEHMCSSEIHRLFGIKREFPDFESV